MSHGELVELVLKQQEQIAQLTALVEQLSRRVAELERGSKRQAAPFSKNQPKADPKPPGRRPGSGRFERRSAPQPESYSQPPLDVPVIETACPDCGGALVSEPSEIVTTTDAPWPPKPIITAYRVAIRRCRCCGRRVRGRHPEVAADQFGATAHRLGARVMATGHWLHYGIGVPVRRVPQILEQLCGIRLTQSALTQDALARLEGPVGDAAKGLREEIATRGHVHADDTGWRINGSSAWLMGFSSDHETVFQIRRRHGNAEVREVIGGDYAGVLHTDRFSSYDATELESVRQQKCLSHVLRNLGEAIDAQRGRARALPLALTELLQEAIALWRDREQTRGFRKRADDIARRVSALLRHRPLRSTINARLVNELGWHDDRGNLLRFLKEPDCCEPTNNEAERALRPAVIARKVSQCSKTMRGAEAHATFAGIIATLVKREAASVVDAICRLFASGKMPALPTA